MIVLVAVKVEREPLAFTGIILGSLLGTFILDLDYIIYAYFLEPGQDFSKTLTAFIKHGDLLNALTYINYHKHNIKDKILNSGLFQIVLGASLFFVASSNTAIFVKALVFSAFVNSLYRLAESYFENRVDDWFWALKNKPTKQVLVVYSTVLLGVFIYCLSIF